MLTFNDLKEMFSPFTTRLKKFLKSGTFVGLIYASFVFLWVAVAVRSSSLEQEQELQNKTEACEEVCAPLEIRHVGQFCICENGQAFSEKPVCWEPVQ